MSQASGHGPCRSQNMQVAYVRVVLESQSFKEDFYVDHPGHYDTLHGYEDLCLC